MDSVDLYRRLDQGAGAGPVSDPARIDAVVEDIRGALTNALQAPSTVRGWRAQALFGSIVAALDGCELMMLIDSGEIFFDGESVKAPDYFLRLRDGRRVLVDVKADDRVPDSIDLAVKYSASEIRRLRRFGDLYDAPVFIAVYFEAPVLWVLVPLHRLTEGPGGGYRLTFKETLLYNEMAILGDYMVGTVPPLTWVLKFDPVEPQTRSADGTLSAQVDEVVQFAGGVKLQAPEAEQIASFLMQYGGWENRVENVFEGDRLLEQHRIVEPPEVSEQGFEMVGQLSAMYSRMFEQSTQSTEGPTALDLDVAPGSLVTLIPHDYDLDELPLWRMRVHPDYATGTSEVQDDRTA